MKRWENTKFEMHLNGFISSGWAFVAMTAGSLLRSWLIDSHETTRNWIRLLKELFAVESSWKLFKLEGTFWKRCWQIFSYIFYLRTIVRLQSGSQTILWWFCFHMKLFLSKSVNIEAKSFLKAPKSFSAFQNLCYAALAVNLCTDCSFKFNKYCFSKFSMHRILNFPNFAKDS